MSAEKKIALVVDDKIVARFADSVAGHEDAFYLHKNLASRRRHHFLYAAPAGKQAQVHLSDPTTSPIHYWY